MSQRTFSVESPFGLFRLHLLTIQERIQCRRIASSIWGGPLPEPDSPEAGSMECRIAWWLAELQLATSEAPSKAWDWGIVLNDSDDATLDKLVDFWGGYAMARDTFRGGDSQSNETASKDA